MNFGDSALSPDTSPTTIVIADFNTRIPLSRAMRMGYPKAYARVANQSSPRSDSFANCGKCFPPRLRGGIWWNLVRFQSRSAIARWILRRREPSSSSGSISLRRKQCLRPATRWGAHLWVHGGKREQGGEFAEEFCGLILADLFSLPQTNAQAFLKTSGREPISMELFQKECQEM